MNQFVVQESLSLRKWKKSNLSDTELALILIRYIGEQRYDLDNLKQHWARQARNLLEHNNLQVPMLVP
jgi:hypothetical protein